MLTLVLMLTACSLKPRVVEVPVPAIETFPTQLVPDCTVPRFTGRTIGDVITYNDLLVAWGKECEADVDTLDKYIEGRFKNADEGESK